MILENSYRTLELPMNKKQFQDHLVSFLHAAGFLQHDEEVLELTFDTKAFKNSSEPTLPLSLKIKKEERMVVENFG